MCIGIKAFHELSDSILSVVSLLGGRASVHSGFLSSVQGTRLHYESKAVHSQCLNNADIGVGFIYQHKLVQGALNAEPRVPRTQARLCFLLRRASAAVLPFCISLGAKARACEVSYRSPI